MEILSAGRSRLVDLAAVVISTFLGYAWTGPVGAVTFGGSLLVVSLLFEIYVRRSAKRLQEFEDRINELEDDEDA